MNHGGSKLENIVKQTPNSPQFKIRFFDESDHQKVKRIAEQENRSITYIVNQAIKLFLQTKEALK